MWQLAKQLTLDSAASNLRCSNPALQLLALQRLRSLLYWGPEWSPDTASQLAAKGLLPELAALVVPGADASEAGVALLAARVHACAHARPWLECS